MDVITLAMTKPKVIDLDKYGIGEAILNNFSSNGGMLFLENMQQFWSDISTNKQLRLEMNFDIARLVIDQCTRAKTGDGFGLLSFSVLLMLPTSTLDKYELDICIMRQNDNAIVSVDVEAR